MHYHGDLRMALDILHLIDPGTPGGGACTLRLLGDLMRYSSETSHRALIVGTRRHVELARRCGVEPIGAVCPPRSLPLSAGRAVRKLLQAIRTDAERFDLIHAWTHQSALMSALAAAEIPRLATFHVGPLSGWSTRYLVRLLRRNSMPILAASSAVEMECRAIGILNRCLSILPAAVDSHSAGMIKRAAIRIRWANQAGVAPDAFVVGLLAEPLRWADAQFAVRVMARVGLSGRRVHLVTHDSMSRRAETEQFLRRIDLDALIIHDDAVAEPWRIAAGLDAALSLGSGPGPMNGRIGAQRLNPSVLPLLWACAAGVPIIAENRDFVRDIVESSVNGLLAEPGDVNALSDHVACLHDNRELAQRLGAVARAAAVDTFSMHEYVLRLNHAYELLLADRDVQVMERASERAASKPDPATHVINA